MENLLQIQIRMEVIIQKIQILVIMEVVIKANQIQMEVQTKVKQIIQIKTISQGQE